MSQEVSRDLRAKTLNLASNSGIRPAGIHRRYCLPGVIVDGLEELTPGRRENLGKFRLRGSETNLEVEEMKDEGRGQVGVGGQEQDRPG